jgi:hypothetical protein
MHIGLLTESVKRRENLIELGVDGEAMLYWNLRLRARKISGFCEHVNDPGIAFSTGVTTTVRGIINRRVFYFETRRFGDWIQSPYSGRTYSVGPNR